MAKVVGTRRRAVHLHPYAKIQGTVSIVGAGFPRPMGWETQPLRIPFSRLGPLRPCAVALNIPPIFNPANPLIQSILIQTTPTLHSAGVLFLDQSPFYRHYAPLERKAIPLLPSLSRLPLRRCVKFCFDSCRFAWIRGWLFTYYVSVVVGRDSHLDSRSSILENRPTRIYVLCVKYSSHLQSCESFNPEHPDSDNPHIALRWSAVLGSIALL